MNTEPESDNDQPGLPLRKWGEVQGIENFDGQGWHIGDAADSARVAYYDWQKANVAERRKVTVLSISTTATDAEDTPARFVLTVLYAEELPPEFVKEPKP